MTAIYFSMISMENMEASHNFLSSIYNLIDIESLLAFSLYGEELYNNSPKLRQAFDFKEFSKSEILKWTYLFVSPEYVNPAMEPRAVICNEFTKLRNHISKYHKGTIIYSTASISDSFGNIQGITGILPYIDKLSKIEHDSCNLILESLITTISNYALIDIKKTLLFFCSEINGLGMMKYILEKAAVKNPFKVNILHSLKRLMDVIVEYYPNLIYKYMQSIFYNTDIWKHSKNEIYDKLIDYIQAIKIIETFN